MASLCGESEVVEGMEALEVSQVHAMCFAVVLVLFALLYAISLCVQAPTGGPTRMVYESTGEMASDLCERVADAAFEAISARGVFTLAVCDHKEVMKLLRAVGDHKEVDWSKVVVLFANHECYSMTAATSELLDDQGFATQAGIKELIMPKGRARYESDGVEDAAFYERAVREKAPDFPVLDMVLLHMKADGQIGALFPESKAAADTSLGVIPCVRKDGRAAISLSLETVNAARDVVVVAVETVDTTRKGANHNYCRVHQYTHHVQGMAAAVKRALQRPANAPPAAFPAQHLARPHFLLDENAAADL